MHSALDEAAAIVKAKFAEIARLAALAVSGQDPLTGVLNWKNNSIPASTPVLKGFLFGVHNPDTNSFAVAVFTSGGVQYAWGVAVQANVPAPGSSEDVPLPTYALNFGVASTFDVLAFIANAGTLAVGSIDWGSGSRIIGLKWTDFAALTRLANKVFTQVVTVNPKAASVEINTLNVSKA